MYDQARLTKHRGMIMKSLDVTTIIGFLVREGALSKTYASCSFMGEEGSTAPRKKRVLSRGGAFSMSEKKSPGAAGRANVVVIVAAVVARRG